MTIALYDIVRITGLTNTAVAYGYGDDNQYGVGDTFEVIGLHSAGATVSADDQCVYHVDDLELVTADVDNDHEVEECEDCLHFSCVCDGMEEFGEDDDEYDEEYELENLFEEFSIDYSQYSYMITGDSVIVCDPEGESDSINVDHKNFLEVRRLVLAGDIEKAIALMSVAAGITKWSGGMLQIEEETVRYAGLALTGKLVDRIISMMSEGDEAFQRFAKFLGLTMEQDSFKTRERLMDFAAHDKLDLNDEGWVVAFKNVNNDYFDKHSGTFDNRIGQSPSMPRSMVDDDHDHQCSTGLHVCSPTYLQGFWGTSGKTMRVVVDPRDFVAIPYDYNDSKARVCRYTVVEDVTNNIEDYLTSSPD